MTEIPAWRIEVTRRAEKELQRLNPEDQERIKVAIDRLAAGPSYGDVRKLQGKENEWRLRVGGWRVRFRPDFRARVIFVLHVLARGGAYRK